ncbi:F-box/kelch-repeat protein At3g23880 [Lolium perenne]|uniref:F-box/kelch-repeat protein At3g23880 n=1 Tax=Lolium perenne TaxID=4522 RepID=UPI0021F63996|nr:putative F-box protein At1g47790 [Lolium perenne]
MASTKKTRYAPLIAQLPDRATTSMAEGGATALSLPGDVISVILSWVPVKSVCRFRCVSKDWLALVSDPAFIANHKSRGAPVQLLVGSYCEVDCAPYHSSLQVMDMDGKLLWTIQGFAMMPNVRSSLDNLVCFSGPDGVARVADVTTGKVLVTSPWITGGVSSSNVQQHCAIAISLGRSAVSNSTKVVRLTEYSQDEPQQTCEILTLGVNDSLWRQAPLPPSAVNVFPYESSSATVNGVVHFLSSTYGIQKKPADTVLSFDLETEEWRSKTIQGPLTRDTELWSKTDRVRLTGLSDTLCMIQTEECHANMWLLVDADKSIWVKKYTLPMVKPFYMIEPLSVMPDGVKLLLYYRPANWDESVLRVYDPSVGICSDDIKLPKHTFDKVSICNLHLDYFVTPARSDVHWTVLLGKTAHRDVSP